MEQMEFAFKNINTYLSIYLDLVAIIIEDISYFLSSINIKHCFTTIISFVYISFRYYRTNSAPMI